MPIYNDPKKCQNCNKKLTEAEMARIVRDKTLRLCDKHWVEAVAQIEKIKPLWKL